MKRLLLLLLSSIPQFVFAQLSTDQPFVFTGFIFDKDSVPVDNAYLINYRTLHVTASDSTGRFTTVVQQGDSLMISHISYERKMVFANNSASENNKYYLDINTHSISMVSTRNFDIQLVNFKKNMQVIAAQMAKHGVPMAMNNLGNKPANPYAPGSAQYIGFGFSLQDMIKLFSRKKKKPATE